MNLIEDTAQSFVRLIMRVIVLLLLFAVLSELPPLQGLSIPGVPTKPIDLLKAVIFFLIAATLLGARAELSGKIAAFTSGRTVAPRVASLTVIFLSILSLYFGVEDLVLFADQGRLGEQYGFLCASAFALALPIVAIGVILYCGSDSLSRSMATPKRRKARRSVADEIVPMISIRPKPSDARPALKVERA